MIVLDASLAVKLVIPEPDSNLADHWFATSRDDIVAPDLIAIEVSQAIVRRVNDRVVSGAEGRIALQEWRAILDGNAVLTFRTLPAQVARAAEFAIRLGHPIKDCVYLALAIEHGCDLITCDAKFAAKARAAYPDIKLLADYAS